MFRKVIAYLVLGLWLGLLGVEFSEQLGLFAFADEQTDQATDTALESFGYAIQLWDDQYSTAATHWLGQLALDGSIDISPVFEPLVLAYKYRLAATVPKHSIPIFKLCLNFRI